MTPKRAPTDQPGPRVRSTPYARRLARERGIPLSALAGTGPNGRVTGKDVTEFVPAVATAAVATVHAPMPAALAASVSLAAIRDLLPQFDDVVPAIELVDVCLKATAAALRSAPDLATVIVLDSRRLAGLDRLTLGAIAALRQESDSADEAADGGDLVVTWIDRAGIRPVAMPMPEGAAARLVIAASADSDRAECLFSYDPRRIGDSEAADFLLAFKAAMEIPLRLIA